MNEYVRIKEPKVLNGRNLISRLLFSRKIRKYFLSDKMVFRYDTEIGNLTADILQIPAIASVITVAFALGADVCVETLDETYLKSLNKVRSILESWYPEFSFSTQIDVNNVVSNRFSNKGFGLLFGGGIDSTASYIRHRHEKPNLITVFGAGVDFQLEDDVLVAKLKRFSKQEQAKLNLVRTDVDGVINCDLLHEKFGYWWVHVYYGLFLTGLCAPLTCVENIGTVLIASGGIPEWKYPEGSHPLVDNKISWADVEVKHDGYDISRQDKIHHFISDYTRESKPHSFLRVCNKRSSDNCGRCEKCLRTITGLTLESVDPNKCGFNNVNNKTFDLLKASLTSGNLLERRSLVERKGMFFSRIARVSYWEDIQKHIAETIDDSNNYGEFFKWLKDFDIQRHSQNIKVSRLPRLLMNSIALNLAPLNSYLPQNLQKASRKVFRLLFRPRI